MDRRYWKYPHANIKLAMWIDLDSPKHSHYHIGYRLRVNDIVIFDGTDFGVPRGQNPLGKESRLSLLTFLTMHRGDTDPEYFDNYTEEQLAWSETSLCEELSWWAIDQEERGMR